MSLLLDTEIERINRRYGKDIKDVFMEKRHTNMMKTEPWIHKKKNNKKYRYKNTQHEIKYNPDPYKFLKLPENMKEIILNLCEKNNISLQQLAIKINVRLHIIDNYINNNYTIDNNILHNILKVLNFDLCKYIEEKNKL